MYVPASHYICTLTRKCFDIISTGDRFTDTCSGITSLESVNQEVIKQIKLTAQRQAFVQELMQEGSTSNKDQRSLQETITDNDMSDEESGENGDEWGDCW